MTTSGFDHARGRRVSAAHRLWDEPVEAGDERSPFVRPVHGRWSA